MSSKADNPFTGKVRARACGLVVRNHRLLLVKINAPTRPEPFWMPPGGGISFGESLEEAVEREVREETGLSVKSRELVFVSEYINNRWHALEYYFRCEILSGEMRLGSDPEIPASSQMLEDIGWFDDSMMDNLNVFPKFISEHRREILSADEMPLRFVKQ
ncbi:MAG: NUDIX domain-containing protein [Balneolia bacterium]|nr:NUDIX domain-containing protein [Balneolia bacterium]